MAQFCHSRRAGRLHQGGAERSRDLRTALGSDALTLVNMGALAEEPSGLLADLAGEAGEGVARAHLTSPR